MTDPTNLIGDRMKRRSAREIRAQRTVDQQMAIAAHHDDPVAYMRAFQSACETDYFATGDPHDLAILQILDSVFHDDPAS